MSRIAPPRTSNAKDRPTRWRLLLRRQRRLFGPAVLGLVGFVGVMTAMVASHSSDQVGGRLPGFDDGIARALGLKVRDIVVEGRVNTPEPLLREAIGVSAGDPILGFSVEGARQRIESLSWVQHVAVERRLPGTIVVQITERRPFAIWQTQGRFVLIDRDGQVVADEDVAAFAELPLVVGTGAPEQAAALIDTLDTAPEIKNRIAAAVRVGQRRWNLQLRNHLTVLLPEGHVPEALARLTELQTTQSLLDRPLAVVDLRLPDRLVVRASLPVPPPPHPIGPKRAT
ncbi:MAG TPA: cell division protein FtsQ/DivIB [Acetobacteraceae bacterium]|nr:cell division protein FtsQ/DivIB [Acetobacteraceae bacterium]